MMRHPLRFNGEVGSSLSAGPAKIGSGQWVFFAVFSGLRFLPRLHPPGAVPRVGRFSFSSKQRVIHRNLSPRFAATSPARCFEAKPKGEIMTAEQIEFLAWMLIKGQAVLVKRGGKIVPVSRI